MMFSLLLFGCEIQSKQGDISSVSKEDKIRLSILAGQSTSDAGIEDMITEVIQNKFPFVTLEWECVNWGEKFDSQMLWRFASGDEPDIMIGKAQDVYTYVGRDNLAPIQVEGLEQIKEQALEAVTIDGQVYAVPYNALYQGVLYNKRIFAELGLDVPQNLKDLNHIVNRLKQEQITPFAVHYQESWKVGNMTMQFLMNNIFNEQKDWGEKFRKEEVNFVNNKEIESCMKQNQYILLNSWSDALIIDQYESDRRFFEGEAAMYLTGSWSLQSISQYNNTNEYGLFPYPNEKGDAMLIRETNMVFMKSKETKHSDLIDQIFQELLSNTTLMKEILNFTQTYSVVKNIKSCVEENINQDILKYESNNRVIEVTLGNKQLIWPFQNGLAEEQLKWLQGKQTLDAVFAYADKYRMESGN